MDKNMKILLVDDEVGFLETACKRLTRRGYPAKGETPCAGAQQVIGSGWPDVVVLDVMLPASRSCLNARWACKAWSMAPVTTVSNR